MRIGLSTPVIERGKTGIARYVISLTRAFTAHARQHDFVLFVFEEDLPLFEFARDAMEIVPISERHRPAVKNILWHQFELPRLVRKHRLDVLHVPSYRRLLWRQPCALVATIHDLAPFHVPEKYDVLRMFYGRVIVRSLAARQHEIITVSESTARDVVTYYRVPPEHVTVIPNGVDHARFTPGRKAEAKEHITRRYALLRPFFLYLARLEHPAKNHLRLIEAFSRFKATTELPWQLVLAGQDWHGAEAIHQAIQKSPHGHDILHLGFVGDEDLPDLLRAADVFVYPSLHEGFGIPPLEAMACGCPVLSSTGGALPEVVGDAACLIPPEDVAAWTQHLTRMATDAAWRARWTEAGLTRAQRFNWHDIATATLQVYAQAAAGRAWAPCAEKLA